MIQRHRNIKTKSRFKSVVEQLPVTQDFTYPGGTLLASYDGGPTETASKTETISWSGRNWKRPWLSCACIHTKVYEWVKYDGPIVLLRQTVASPTRKQLNNSYLAHTHPALSQAVTSAKASLSSNGLGAGFLFVNGQQLMDDNFDLMRPDLTEVSVPNFLFELKQIKSLVSFWDRRRQRVKGLSKDSLASSNLWWQYGVKPTVGDLSSILFGVWALREKLHNWNARLGKLSSMTRTVLSDTITNSGTENLSGLGVLYPIAWRITVQRKATAHILYRPQRIAAISELDMLLRGLLDTWGIELNPAHIWNAVPFSFILDWVLDVGSILDRFRIDALELPILVEDSYLQYKEVLSVDASLRRLPDANNPAITYPGSAYQSETFHRLQFTPSRERLFSLGWKLPSLNQAGLGASLLVGLRHLWR